MHRYTRKSTLRRSWYGAEILSLAQAFPEWTCVGVDPAQGMLDVCREILAAAGVSGRCELVHPEGILVNTEISFDLDSKEFPSMLQNWKAVQQLMGATPESLANLGATACNAEGLATC